MRLEGKVVLITASTRGIGLACVERFAREGAKVYMGARNLERAQGVADRLNAEGCKVDIVYNDATEKESYQTMVDEVIAKEGRIDVLVNNFGTSNPKKDLDIKATRASWAWWQHVNKTDSAIHMTHIPTWISVFCQEWRSQHKNKEKAFQILRSKIYAMEEERRIRERGEQRLAQVWSGDRSEKIRTYNFPQDRVTDHRIGQNFSGIPQIMMWKLGHIVDALAVADEQAKLEAASKINE